MLELVGSRSSRCDAIAIAIKDIITAAKTVHLAQTDELHSRFGALFDSLNPGHYISCLRRYMFQFSYLAPDKSYDSIGTFGYFRAFLFIVISASLNDCLKTWNCSIVLPPAIYTWYGKRVSKRGKNR